jgi:ABC-type transport system involved in cytochrome c biogenesis permease subunit
MLTWGRTDDASLFVLSDLSFALVLFRLAINRWSVPWLGCYSSVTALLGGLLTSRNKAASEPK